MNHNELSSRLEQLPVVQAQSFRVYGSTVDISPPVVEDCAYRAWYLSIGQNRERHVWREILVTLDGSCPFGWKNRVLWMDPGSILLIDKLEPHALFYPSELRDIVHLWFAWPKTGHELVVALVFDTGERLVSVSLLHVSMIEEPFATFGSLWQECAAVSEKGETLNTLLCEKLKAYAVVVVFEAISLLSSFTVEDQHSPQWVVKTVKDFIDAHPESSFSLSDLAAIAGYSKFHFHRIFREVTGETIHSYTTRRRIAHALALLKHGYSCSAIAKDMRFTSVSSFSRWFKEHSGITPSQV